MFSLLPSNTVSEIRSLQHAGQIGDSVEVRIRMSPSRSQQSANTESIYQISAAIRFEAQRSTNMSVQKVAIVTGGNSGIGYEAVKSLLLSTKPYHVFLGSRSIEKGNSALDSLRQECPNATNKLDLLQVDLTSDESIEKAYQQISAVPGRLDVLVNNAGKHAFGSKRS